MPIFTDDLPLSLYIHLPWCVKKCPYCDFNSHEVKDNLPESLYVTALLQEFSAYLPLIKDRSIISIFFGGGTPSLFSAKAIRAILDGITQRASLSPQIEVTLEANPGTVDSERFAAFRDAGVNRLSIGVQSLQDNKLKSLGRIHDTKAALVAIESAIQAGFRNFNLDLMYGLPHQSSTDAMHDLELALSFHPPHLSWYQLTIEPNTYFYHQRPALPDEDKLWEIQTQGLRLLNQYGMQPYEVSAYALPKQQCLHNNNYWKFGDYLGLGAGAHSKITQRIEGKVIRFSQVKHPRDYLNPNRQPPPANVLSDKELAFEFMLNALRLTDGIPLSLFSERTGLAIETINPLLTIAKNRGLLSVTDRLCPTALGKRFLNDLVEIFLP